MSKKKNTLKDLDEFLKQQAATLVTPAQLSGKVEAQKEEQIEAEPQEQSPPTRPSQAITATRVTTLDHVVEDVREIARMEGTRFKPMLYNILLRALSNQTDYTAEDKMLINTLLYLKHGENWKSAIQEFWKGR